MPRYRIHHLTRYTYDEAVSVCHNVAHLLPRDAPPPDRHTWHFADLDISPLPAVRTERRDYFGNRLTFFAIQEPHRELSVSARSEVDITPPPPPSTDPGPPWELARDALRNPHQRAGGLDAFQYTFASPFIHISDDVRDYALPSFAPGRPLVEAVLDLASRIYRDFKYDPKCTTVTTTLPEVLTARAGVCQDFAHLAVGCLRSLGLAARYVSGYLMTVPPPGKPRLVGADASHAWPSIYVPALATDMSSSSGGAAEYGGWLDVDPTNNTRISDQHITLAWGRDFGDVSPLRGVLLGTGRHAITVSVDVVPISQRQP